MFNKGNQVGGQQVCFYCLLTKFNKLTTKSRTIVIQFQIILLSSSLTKLHIDMYLSCSICHLDK